MNHIYKTIFNKKTGQVVVVSEKTSNNCQSQQEASIWPKTSQERSSTEVAAPFLKKQLTIAISILFCSLVGQMSYAETTQEYTGTETLANSSMLPNGFKDLINNPNGDKKGIVVIDINNDLATSDTVLTVDNSEGTAPDFVVAGYATFNKGDATEILEVGNNQITLKKGDINGPVYAGLVQHTQKTNTIDCAINPTLCDANGTSITKMDQFNNIQIVNNTNVITIEEDSSIQINGDLTAGQNLIQLQYNDLNAANAAIYSSYAWLGSDTLLITSSANANVSANTNQFTANQNTISMDGVTLAQNINAGQNLIQQQYNDLNAANADMNIDVNIDVNIMVSAIADANVGAETANNKNQFTANENTISMNGKTLAQNISAGQNLIQLQYHDFNAAKATANVSANANANTTKASLSAIATAITTASAYNNDNQFIANENTISMSGITTAQNISAGENLIHLQYHDFNAAYATATTKAEANAYAPSYVSVNVYTNDNQFTANENTILMNGTTEAKNISAGQNLIHLQYHDFNAATATASDDLRAYANANADVVAGTNASNNQFSANQNTISMNGTTEAKNISAGQNLINLQYHDFNAANTSADAKAEVSTYVNADTNGMATTYVYNIASGYANASNNQFSANQNTISMNGKTLAQNISAGENLIRFKYHDFNAATADATVEAEADVYADARAYATATARTYNNQFTANKNTISMSGITTAQNISSGQNLIHLQYGDFNAADIKVNLSAEAYADATTEAYANANANAYNNQFTANENTISIDGTTSAKNISAGQAGIKLEYGNITAGKETRIINGVEDLRFSQASLSVDLGDTSLKAHQNKIDLKGSSTISGDVKTGQIDFYLGYDSLKNGDDTETFPLLYLKGNDNYIIPGNTVIPDTLKPNVINLNGSKAFANDNTISIEGAHTFSNPESVIYGGYLNYNKDKTYFIADANGNATTETGFVRPESYDVFTGNTLQYNNSIPVTIKEIGNFQAYNFTLNPELADGTTALIKANKIILGSSDDNMSTDQVQKQIYNSISIAAQTSESLDNAIKEALPSIADDEVNPNYAISDDIKDAVLNAEDISQSVKNLLTTGKIASDIKVIGIQSGKLLDTNTKFILMQADQGQLSGLGQGYLSKGVAQQGISLLYDVETSVDQANDQVIALINMGHKSPTDPTPTDPTPTDPTPTDPTPTDPTPTDPTPTDPTPTDPTPTDPTPTDPTPTDPTPTDPTPTDPTPTDPTPTDPTPTDPVPEDPRDLEPTGPKVNPQLKALLKGNLSGLMLLTRSEDQFSNYSFDQEHLRGLVPFVIASGNYSRYDTGSHIKSNGGLFTMGFSVHDDDWTWGAFIENGWDSYKTHDSFKDAKTVNGRGHNRFNGVGLFGNYDFNNGWYVDGTLRGGRLHTSFETDDLRNAVTNERAEYDLSSNYYGVSLKGGYNFTWNPQNELDLSAKYAWVGTESHRLTIAGDPIYFDKLNSHRLRLNAENSYQMNSDFNVLTGLGYEHEFAGKAKGTTYGVYDIEESSVKGGTGIATLGLRYQPAANQRLNIDLKGSGYFGKREGGSALLKVDYKF